jgi:hypothetical protein
MIKSKKRGTKTPSKLDTNYQGVHHESANQIYTLLQKRPATL